MPSGAVARATSTAHSGDASEAVDKAESSPARLQPPTILDIDPDGDLVLDVKPRKDAPYRFRVCSRTLRRHSPVWKTMLFGPWSESQPTNGKEWIVQLPEDSASAMEIVLDIVHGRFDRVPQKFNRFPRDERLATLRGVLILANKYDMTSIVRPWCAQWIALARGPKEFNYTVSASDKIRSLYVAWELGDEKLFALRLEELSLYSALNADGLLIYSSGGWVLNHESYLGPQDALDTICAIREVVIERLITPFHEDLDAQTKTEPYCKVGSSAYRRRRCDAGTIGRIHQHMLELRGSMLPKSASEIEDEVVELASRLFAVTDLVLTRHGLYMSNPNGLDAPKCECFPAPKYKKLCCSIRDDIPTVVAGFITPSHREYMAAQRAKSGLVMEDISPMRAYWSWPSHLEL